MIGLGTLDIHLSVKDDSPPRLGLCLHNGPFFVRIDSLIWSAVVPTSSGNDTCPQQKVSIQSQQNGGWLSLKITREFFILTRSVINKHIYDTFITPKRTVKKHRISFLNYPRPVCLTVISMMYVSCKTSQKQTFKTRCCKQEILSENQHLKDFEVKVNFLYFQNR